MEIQEGYYWVRLFYDSELEKAHYSEKRKEWTDSEQRIICYQDEEDCIFWKDKPENRLTPTNI